jgi:hypothetical protein
VPEEALEICVWVENSGGIIESKALPVLQKAKSEGGQQIVKSTHPPKSFKQAPEIKHFSKT